MPDETVPIPVSPSANRAVASHMVTGAIGLPVLSASLVVDAIDVAASSVLASLGLSRHEVALVLDAMWSR